MNSPINLQRRRALLVSAATVLPLATWATPTLRSFELDSLSRIHAGPRPYVLTLWGLNCAPCVQVLRELARWQSRLRIVTVAVDSIDESEALLHELAQARLASEAWVFGRTAPEALRYAIDPKWSGEKPRHYLVGANSSRRVVSGLLKPEDLQVMVR